MLTEDGGLFPIILVNLFFHFYCGETFDYLNGKGAIKITFS